MAPRSVAVRERAPLCLIYRRGDLTRSHDCRTRCLNSWPGLLRRVSYNRSDVDREPFEQDHRCEHLDDCPDLDGADNRIDHRQRFGRYV
jgi:hypothetical protein